MKNNELILKTHHKFKSKKHNASTEKLTRLHWVLIIINKYN